MNEYDQIPKCPSLACSIGLSTSATGKQFHDTNHSKIVNNSEEKNTLGLLFQRQPVPLMSENKWMKDSIEYSPLHVFLYKKLGSDHSSKSFLISHEILSILVSKVS